MIDYPETTQQVSRHWKDGPQGLLFLILNVKSCLLKSLKVHIKLLSNRKVQEPFPIYVLGWM